MGSFGLPPLMDSSPYNSTKSKPVPNSVNVPCFSNNPMNNNNNNVQRNQDETMVDSLNNNNNNNSSVLYGVVSNNPSGIPRLSPLSYSAAQNAAVSSSMQFPNSVMLHQHNHEQSILRALLENNGSNLRQSFKTEGETAMNSEVNTGISSVMANLQMGRRPFGDQAQPTHATAGPVDVESFWNY